MELFRHAGLPYDWLPAARLTEKDISSRAVIVLPNVTCLSAAQRRALKEDTEQGGVLVAFGPCAIKD